MTSFPTGRRLWLPLRATALPVRVVLDGGSDLDALEEALLGLLRLAPRDPGELARKLRLSESLVRSALARLCDRDLAVAPDAAAGLFACGVDVRSSLAAAARPGWAFYCAGVGFLPAVVLAERLPEDARFRPANDALEVDGERGADELPHRASLERALQRLLVSRQVTAVDGGRRGDATQVSVPTVELAGQRLPSLVAGSGPLRLRSLVLEGGDARRRRSYPVWAPIDLLPRMRGSAVAVFHEPVVDARSEDESPIAPQLAGWVERADARGWAVVQAQRELVHIDMSLVLTRAGIDSQTALDAQVAEHARQSATRVRLDEIAAPPGDQQLIEKVVDAQRWLVLAQREPAFRAQARDAWAHAVEELTAALAEIARPQLARWRRLAQRTLTSDEVTRRLELLELRRSLGESERHLRSAATDPGLTKDLDRGANGAGANVTLWLLPLVLLDADAARVYAVHVRLAKERHPELFDDLGELIAARNYAFHEGRGKSADRLASDLPEHCERRFMAVFAALHVALASGPPGSLDGSATAHR